MEKPSTKKPMNVLKNMVFLKNFMKFTLRNDYTGRMIKVLNVCDLRIEQTGHGPEQGFADTRKLWIIYTTTQNPFKELKLEYNPNLEHLQIT